MRRLADLCFVFGLYSFANQLYQNMRKEFAVDQAWMYHAGALVSHFANFFLNIVFPIVFRFSTQRQHEVMV